MRNLLTDSTVPVLLLQFLLYTWEYWAPTKSEYFPYKNVRLVKIKAKVNQIFKKTKIVY